MRSFFHVSDIGDLGKALEEAKQVKATPFAWQNLGRNKTIILIFFNSPPEQPEGGHESGNELDSAQCQWRQLET